MGLLLQTGVVSVGSFIFKEMEKDKGVQALRPLTFGTPHKPACFRLCWDVLSAVPDQLDCKVHALKHNTQW